jgi:hypothetical protein
LLIQSFFFAEETVKAKWKNLRDVYIKHKKLTKGTTGQAGKRYRNWRWAPHMQFLDRTLEVRLSDSNIPNLPDTETPIHDSDTQSEDIDIETSSEMGPLPSKKSQKKQPDNLDRVLEYLQEKSEQRKLTCDAIDHQFLSYAQTFKTFSLRNQTRLKISLANLFAEAELHEADERYEALPSPSYSTSDSGRSNACSIVDHPCLSSDQSLYSQDMLSDISTCHQVTTKIWCFLHSLMLLRSPTQRMRM